MKKTGRLNRLKLNNAGFSLMELLVVIAIMAVFTGLGGVGISMAVSRDAQKSAKIIDDALERSRLCAMSRVGDYTVEIDLSDNILTVAGEGQEELPQKVKIYVSGETVDVISIRFDKSTGKVAEILFDGVTYPETVLKITSENSTGKKATVVQVVNTGKHFIEYS